MPAEPNANTLVIGQQIVSFLTVLAAPGTSSPLIYKLAQLEAIKDITDQVAGGGVCVEVYGDQDTSDRHGFGGRIWDIQTWAILSICSQDTPALAQQIYTVRDALVYPFQQHATLGTQVFNLFHSQLNDNMKFGQVYRDGSWYRSHLAMLTTKQEWVIQGGIIS